MALALDQLVFSVDSTQLDEARIKIAKLGDAVAALNKPLQDMSRSSAKTNEVIAKSELAAEKARAATKALGDQVEDSGEQMSKTEKYLDRLSMGMKLFRGEVVSVQAGTLELGNGFTRGQANALAYQIQLGATKDQLGAISKEFKDLNAFSNTNPFDKSTRGLSALRQEIAELEMVDKFMRDGFSLTKEQIVNLAKDSERLSQSYKSMKKSEDELAQALKTLHDQTIENAKVKNTLVQAAKESELQAKKEAQSILDEQRARSIANVEIEKQMNLYRSSVWKEWGASVGQSSKELKDMAQYYRELNVQAENQMNLLRKNTWKEWAGGVGKASEEIINLNKYFSNMETEALQAESALSKLHNTMRQSAWKEWAGGVGVKSQEQSQLSEMYKAGQSSFEIKRDTTMDQAVMEFYKKQELATRQLTAAEDDLILREQKLAFVNKELAAGLSTASANALFNYQKDLEALGKSADEVSRRMTAFRAGLVERQGHSPFTKLTQEAETTNKRLDHLSRALGPQITDIFVGLATGQSLLTVALQQGGQIRDQIALSGVASANMGKALSAAAVQMVGSLKDVSVAMGTLLITPFIAGGKAVTDFATKILFANKTIQSYSLAIAMYADNGNKLASGLVSAMSKIPMLIGASFAAVTLAVTTLTVAFFVAQKELDNLSKQLILTGGSLGLNKDLALDYAKSLDGVSGSTSQVVAVIQAMAKEGRFLREEISLVTKSAIELEKYAGVSIEDTVKAFAKLKEEPVKALLELAKQTGMVSAETLNMVVALEKQGNTSQAASVAIKALADINNEQVERMKRDYSSLGLMLIEVGDWFANLWRQAKGVVYEPTAMDQAVKALQQADVALSEAQKSLNSSENLSIRPSTQAIDILRQRLDARKNEYVQLIKNQQAENQSRINNVAIADAKKRSLDLEASAMSPIEKAKSNIAKYTGEIAKAEQLVASTKDEQVIKDTLISNLKKSIAKENENIAKENKKNNADQLSEAKKIENFGKKALEESRKYIAGERAEVEQTTEAWKRYLKLEESDFWTKIPESLRSQIRLNYQLADAEERMREQRTKSQEEFMKNFGEIARLNSETYRKNTVSIQQAKEEAESIKYQASLIGLSSDEREKLLALKKIDLQTEKDINDLISKGIPLNATVIQQTRDLGQLQKDNVQAMLDLKQYEKLMSELGDVMFLALTNRGAQAGKKLRDLIKAELMKPITLVVNAVVNTLLGQVSGTLGLSTGSAGSALSVASNLSGLTGIGSAFGTAFGGAAMSTLGLGGSSAAMTTSLANAGYWSGGAAATSASSLGASIGAYAPYALAAVVALDQLGILDRWSGDPDAFLVQQATGVNQQFASSTQSRLGTVGFVNGSATIMRNGRLVSEYGETEGITTDAQKSALDVITALDNAVADTLSQSQIVEISKNLSGWFQKSWSVESGTIENFIASRYETILGTLDSSFGKLKDYQKEGEKLSDTAVRLITTFTTVKTVFENIGVSIDGLTYKAANDFATVFGGVDKLGSSLSKFYDTFYTEAEKTVNLAKNTTEAFNALGLALPSSRDAFKELVKSSINAGDPQLLASLLGLQDAFTTLTEPVEELKNKFKELSDSLLEEVDRLRGAVISDVSLSGGIPGLTAEFAMLTVQAKSGNTTALEKLPEYSQAIEQAVAASAVNASDVAYARAWLAESLGNTNAVLTGTSPSIVSSSLTQDVAGTTTVNGATAIVASSSSQSDLIAALIAEVQGLRAEVRADVSANSKTAKILERANQDGETLSVSVV